MIMQMVVPSLMKGDDSPDNNVSEDIFSSGYYDEKKVQEVVKRDSMMAAYRAIYSISTSSHQMFLVVLHLIFSLYITIIVIEYKLYTNAVP